MTWWKGLIAGVLLLAVAAITVAGLRDRPPPAQPRSRSPRSARATITRTITGAGKVQAATTVKISSNLSGDLVELPVKVGDRVTKGQVLGRIDPRALRGGGEAGAGVRQSAARADVAGRAGRGRIAPRRSWAAWRALAEKGMASRRRGGQGAGRTATGALARLARPSSGLRRRPPPLEEAQTNLSKTTLLSPIDGNVIELSREVGERVRGSDFSEDVVMTIAALNSDGGEDRGRRARGRAPQARPARGAHGGRARGPDLRGQVVEIAQKALIKNPGTEAEVTTFPVTVALDTPPPGVLPGMSAEVRITAETHEDAVHRPHPGGDGARRARSLPDYQPPVRGHVAHGPKQRRESLAKVVFVVDEDNKAQRAPRAHRASPPTPTWRSSRASRRARGWWRAPTARCPRS